MSDTLTTRERLGLKAFASLQNYGEVRFVDDHNGYMPNVGMRVFVTGTKHHGFRGVVVDRCWRSIKVKLDEFEEPVILYTHNLILEDLMQ